MGIYIYATHCALGSVGLRENHPQIARALVTKQDFICPMLRTTAFGVVCAGCAASTANNFTHTHTNPNVVVSGGMAWIQNGFVVVVADARSLARTKRAKHL